VLNILTENSCLTSEMAALLISQVESVSNFSLCRRLSAVAPALHSTRCVGGLAKADALVAETPLAAEKPFGEDGSIKNNKLFKTNPISQNLKWL